MSDVPTALQANAHSSVTIHAVIASVPPITVSLAMAEKCSSTMETELHLADQSATMVNSMMKTERDADHASMDAMSVPTKPIASSAMLDFSTLLVLKKISVWNHAPKVPSMMEMETAMAVPMVAKLATAMMFALFAMPSPLLLMTSASANLTTKSLPDLLLNTSKLTSSTFTSTPQTSMLLAERDSIAMRFSTLTPHQQLTSISPISGAMEKTFLKTQPSSKELLSDQTSRNN